MKKLLSAMLLVLVLSSGAFGATSQDVSVYVRQDVFDAKMEALFERLHGEIVEMKSEIKSEIAEIRGDIKALSRRMDGLEKRIEDTNTFLYYILVLFGAMLLLPYVSKFFESRKESQKEPSLTVDEVKRLIANTIAEAQLSGRPQV